MTTQITNVINIDNRAARSMGKFPSVHLSFGAQDADLEAWYLAQPDGPSAVRTILSEHIRAYGTGDMLAPLVERDEYGNKIVQSGNMRRTGVRIYGEQVEWAMNQTNRTGAIKQVLRAAITSAAAPAVTPAAAPAASSVGLQASFDELRSAVLAQLAAIDALAAELTHAQAA